jgi:hypothetical protein
VSTSIFVFSYANPEKDAAYPQSDEDGAEIDAE